MRTLYYVPVIHQDWECDAGTDPKYSPSSEEQTLARMEFQNKYWEYVSQQLLERVKLNNLIRFSRNIDLDLFREGWSSRQVIEQSKEHMIYTASMGDPMGGLLSSMISYNVRTQVTESSFAYGVEGVLLRFKYRYERLRQLCQSYRDRSIATNLKRSVATGKTAVLFIGASHDVPRYLDGDWEVEVITTVDILCILKLIDPKQRHWVDLYLKKEGLNEQDIE